MENSNPIKMYEIGGSVRDDVFHNQPTSSKDIDYVVIGCNTYDDFLQWTAKLKWFKVVYEDEQNQVLRGKHLSTGNFIDISYSVYANLISDISQRDFTINCMAREVYPTKTSKVIDLFNGRCDLIEKKVLKTAGTGEYTFGKDPVRLVRGIRFAVKYNLRLSAEISHAYTNYRLVDKLNNDCYRYRIVKELNKSFQYNLLGTMKLIQEVPYLYDVLFSTARMNLGLEVKF